jgi:tetratricopeptide (TPR) repeat protein
MSRDRLRGIVSFAWKPPLALLVAALAVAALGVGRRQGPGRLLAAAAQALERDDYETAVSTLLELTIAFPDSDEAPAAHYELAGIYHLRTRDLGAAQANLLKILSDYPESRVAPAAQLGLARLYERELDEPEKAVAHYREVLAASGIDEALERDIVMSLGDCYYRLDLLADAASWYRKAIGLPYASQTDGAYLRLARIEHLGGNGDTALVLLRKLASATLEPGRRYDAAEDEVEVLIELGRFSEARERLRDAQAVFPGAVELSELQARLNAAQLSAQSMGEAEGALVELQKKIRWGAARPRASRP